MIILSSTASLVVSESDSRNNESLFQGSRQDKFRCHSQCFIIFICLLRLSRAFLFSILDSKVNFNLNLNNCLITISFSRCQPISSYIRHRCIFHSLSPTTNIFHLAWLLPVAVGRLHDGDLHAVGWGEGP